MLKKIIKSILPASFAKVDKTHREVLDAFVALSRKLSLVEAAEKQRYASFSSELKASIKKLATKDEVAKLATKDEVAKLATRDEVDAARRNAAEAVWSAVFYDAGINCAWLTDRRFFPGRWAVGYPALYAILRVLDNFKPKKILELGLGQSTRLIGQYAASSPSVSHTVVEADPSWIAFFQNDFSLPPNTLVKQLGYEILPYGDTDVRQYQGFAKAFKDASFDFIFIDAPLGGDMKDFSRIDVLGLLPGCLEKSFVIMMDDSNRPGETHTLEKMESLLSENGRSFKRGRYSGQKDTTLLCSEDVGFLASL